MHLLGVIDLAGGQAVHARGGRREAYAPIQAVAGQAIPCGDAVALARTYLATFDLAGLYCADLDAIGGRTPQDDLVRRLAALGAPLWIDRGVTSAERALETSRLGAARVIVGLETLRSFERLDEICAAIGGAQVTFSLDLRDSAPIVASHEMAGGETPETIAARAAAAGVEAIIVLDLARVGTGRGLDLALIARVRHAAPRVQLLAGGGIQRAEDLAALAAAGADGALMATALLSPSSFLLPPDTIGAWTSQ